LVAAARDFKEGLEKLNHAETTSDKKEKVDGKGPAFTPGRVVYRQNEKFKTEILNKSGEGQLTDKKATDTVK
jgi:hypothetical protein